MQLKTKNEKPLPDLFLQIGGIFLVFAEVFGGGLETNLTENETTEIVEAVREKIKS